MYTRLLQSAPMWRLLAPFSLRFRRGDLEESFAQYVQSEISRNLWWALLILISAISIECIITMVTTPNFSPLTQAAQFAYTVGACVMILGGLLLSILSRVPLYLPYLEISIACGGTLFTIILVFFSDHYRVAQMFGEKPFEVWGRPNFSDGPLLLGLNAILWAIAIFLPVRSVCLWPVCLSSVICYQFATFVCDSPDGLRPSFFNIILLVVLSYLALTGRRALEARLRLQFIDMHRTAFKIHLLEQKLSQVCHPSRPTTLEWLFDSLTDAACSIDYVKTCIEDEYPELGSLLASGVSGVRGSLNQLGRIDTLLQVNINSILGDGKNDASSPDKLNESTKLFIRSNFSTFNQQLKSSSSVICGSGGEVGGQQLPPGSCRREVTSPVRRSVSSPASHLTYSIRTVSPPPPVSSSSASSASPRSSEYFTSLSPTAKTQLHGGDGLESPPRSEELQESQSTSLSSSSEPFTGAQLRWSAPLIPAETRDSTALTPVLARLPACLLASCGTPACPAAGSPEIVPDEHNGIIFSEGIRGNWEVSSGGSSSKTNGDLISSNKSNSKSSNVDILGSNNVTKSGSQSQTTEDANSSSAALGSSCSDIHNSSGSSNYALSSTVSSSSNSVHTGMQANQLAAYEEVFAQTPRIFYCAYSGGTKRAPTEKGTVCEVDGARVRGGGKGSVDSTPPSGVFASNNILKSLPPPKPSMPCLPPAPTFPAPIAAALAQSAPRSPRGLAYVEVVGCRTQTLMGALLRTVLRGHLTSHPQEIKEQEKMKEVEGDRENKANEQNGEQLDENEVEQTEAYVEEIEKLACVGGSLPMEVYKIGVDWNLDILSLSARVNNRILECVGTRVLEVYVHCFLTTEAVVALADFLAAAQENYHAQNPYHNAAHGAEVCHSALVLSECLGLFERLTTVEQLALLVASLCHDISHPGKNNTFQVATGSDLAVRYNDHSVLENFHAAETFSLLKKHNFTQNVNRQDYLRFRQCVIELVLATDMCLHFESLSQFKVRRQSSEFSVLTRAEDRWLAVKMCIKAADIGHSCKIWALHEKWSSLCIQEFFIQGDEELRLGLSVSPLCDRSKKDEIPKSQAGFLQFVCLDLYEELSRVEDANALECCQCNLSSSSTDIVHLHPPLPPLQMPGAVASSASTTPGTMTPPERVAPHSSVLTFVAPPGGYVAPPTPASFQLPHIFGRPPLTPHPVLPSPFYGRKRVSFVEAEDDWTMGDEHTVLVVQPTCSKKKGARGSDVTSSTNNTHGFCTRNLTAAAAAVTKPAMQYANSLGPFQVSPSQYVAPSCTSHALQCSGCCTSLVPVEEPRQCIGSRRLSAMGGLLRKWCVEPLLENKIHWQSKADLIDSQKNGSVSRTPPSSAPPSAPPSPRGSSHAIFSGGTGDVQIKCAS